MNHSSSSDGLSEYISDPNHLTVPSALPTQDWHYETTVKKIEDIMARIEAGELDLAEVFDEFAAAVDYLQQCETFLTQRQKQVDLLIETLTDEADF